MDAAQVRVALIAAMATNRVIGRNNQLPWHLPNDLKYFKATTLGKPIIMGRHTFESIGKPLPGRSNMVVTRNPLFTAAGVQVVHSVEAALAQAKTEAIAAGVDEVMVIGGAQIYAECLPLADRLYLTLVDAEIEGDAFFPALNWCDWHELRREDFAADGKGSYGYSFVTYCPQGQ